MLKRYNDIILKRLLENGMLLNRILSLFIFFIFLKFLNNEEEEI